MRGQRSDVNDHEDFMLAILVVNLHIGVRDGLDLGALNNTEDQYMYMQGHCWMCSSRMQFKVIYAATNLPEDVYPDQRFHHNCKR